jgi:hypothetical protein
MPQWLREFLTPIVGWTVVFAFVGASVGAVGAISSAAPLGTPLVLGLFLGAAGLTCGLTYSALALRGRHPRAVAWLPTLVAGASIGAFPVVVLALAAVREGATFQNGVRDGLSMACLGAATAAIVRWRDGRRARTVEALADPSDQEFMAALRQEATERANLTAVGDR